MAAWWGAICGTLALFWEIFSWYRSGPRLVVSASPNMQYVTPGVGIDPTTYINVSVTNVGDQPTTLTHFCGHTYHNWLDYIRKKPDKSFIVNTGPESPIPHKIDVGERWSAMTRQDKAIELAGDSLFYLGVVHATQVKPVLIRVHLPQGNG
jgi:hypothetical protein